MPTIALSTIAKNEAHVLPRMLATVLPVIDAWCVDVCPTSTDGTAQVVERFFRDRAPRLPGFVAQTPPQDDMGRARSAGYAHAERLGTDYVLWIDADDALVVTPGFRKDRLGAPVYDVRVHSGDIVFPRPHLAAAGRGYHFEGVAHEYLVTDTGEPPIVNGIAIRRNIDGPQGDERPRYRRDAERLERFLATHPGDARSWFYAAQCWRDAGDLEKALQRYAHRADLENGFWEERVQARLEILSLLVRLQRWRELDEVTEEFVAFHPPRAPEALYRAAQGALRRQDWLRARNLLVRGLGASVPPDRLFVDRTLYEGRLQDTLAWVLERMGDPTARTVRARLAQDPRAPLTLRVASFAKSFGPA